MESPLLRLLISSRSVNKHGRHTQFLFLIGRFLKGTGYEYNGNVFVAWVLQVRRAEAVTK
jgi:hypothetical protein